MTVGMNPNYLSSSGELSIPTRFGTLALTGHAIKDPAFEYRQLPEGFYYAPPASISADELSDLALQVGLGKDLTSKFFLEQKEGYEEDGIHSIEVGVRYGDDDSLIGYGGLHVNIDRTADLGDFFVSPFFRGRGVGKAIIDQRLLQADNLGITDTSIDRLAPTNTLRSFYEERGFSEQLNGRLVRGLYGEELPPAVTFSRPPLSQGFGAMSRASGLSSLSSLFATPGMMKR
jgi:GNAT superfamily N-acetyltransferase